jgi:hypothetical protein
MLNLDWSKPHILKVGNEIETFEEVKEGDIKSLRQKIEPWLTAVFQSEHLALLAGSGLTKAVASIAKITSQGMDRINFDNYFNDKIRQRADYEAANMDRGNANIEDDLRVAIELYKGLLIQDSSTTRMLKDDIDKSLLDFLQKILKTENDFLHSAEMKLALSYLKSFLISFASRSASRNRLNIFTTNYDRFIEYACDQAGILVLDSFVGKIYPAFRSNRILLDYHYNPPGIRGEPRYVEGVVRYTKLHGSLDWKYDRDQIIKNLIPFGADSDHSAIPKNPFDHVVIYPNSAKDIETVYFPYAELFREFSSAICQPNSVVVTYGYGFGDSHVNRILKDILTIPSTHIVIVSWDLTEGRIQNFIKDKNPSQFTFLIGNHFGDLKSLVDNYMPKAAIDRITEKKHSLLKKRGITADAGEFEQEPALNGGE